MWREAVWVFVLKKGRGGGGGGERGQLRGWGVGGGGQEEGLERIKLWFKQKEIEA